MKIIIDPEFKNFLRKLHPHELEQLEANILAGITIPKVTFWQDHNIVIDGHHTLAICQKHGINDYDRHYVPLADREAVKVWMIRVQLGRRNFGEIEEKYARGQMFQLQKKQQGNPAFSKGDTVSPLEGKTAEKLAEEFGVSERTIYRDSEFAEAVDKLAAEDPEIKQKILTGEMSQKKVFEKVNGDPRLKPPPDAGDAWEPESEEVYKERKEAAKDARKHAPGTVATTVKEVHDAIGNAGKVYHRWARAQGRLTFGSHIYEMLQAALKEFGEFAKEPV